MLTTVFAKRPRNINAYQSAAILYGDWGTSKAYVIGLAFAIAGYSSFWLIAAVGVLMALVGVNYITICEFSPTGGGVYSSSRRRSEVLALIAAFFLIADYLVTACLSALSSFEYLQVPYPQYWAMAVIGLIGAINFFGPRHTGNLALVISLMTIAVVIILGIFSLPYLGEAIHHLEPPQGDKITIWDNFVGIIVALSGIEAIANTTGVMKLDPGSTEEHPSVYRTARKAILMVMIEVCIFTTLFGLAMNAFPDLTVVDHLVYNAEHESIRDSMLRYMGEHFSSPILGVHGGKIFGLIVGLVFAVLLLSAVNTAILALISLLFVMSRDGEMPTKFQVINRFGVPIYPLALVVLACISILIAIHDVAGLANLYAVGFVGAIATNLGVNAEDRSIPMKKWERLLMGVTFVIMALIEITLFVTKPDARRFALSILTAGLILRAVLLEQRQKAWTAKKVKLRHASLYTDDTRTPLHYGAILCAVSTVGKTLDFALQESKRYNQPLYILFVREQKVITEEDLSRIWLDDDDACRIFDYAKDSSHEMTIKFFYAISSSPATTIVEMAEKLQASRLIVGRPRQSMVLQVLRGNIVQEISELLPPDIDLLVIS